MRVGGRVDAGPLIGGGHAMRCLTLVEELAAEGLSATFVAASMTPEIEERIRSRGDGFALITPSPELEPAAADWHQRVLSDAAQEADARATGDALGSVDLMIVDHYLLDRRWHSAARRFANRVVVIDDLANRPYDCDVLVDQTLGRSQADYDGLVPARALALTGAAYALLRPEFKRERAAALKRRQEPTAVRRILVSMGTSDIGGSTAGIVDEVLAAVPDCDVDVVLGGQATSLEHVRELAGRNPRITVHVDSRNMAPLMRDADLAIGAAGTTSWERCCLGLPTIAVIIAENQRAGATALAETGALQAVNSADAVGPALRQLLGEPQKLRQMTAAAFAIVDGLGAERVASAVLGSKDVELAVELRPATLGDSELLWLWRNDPATRAQSRTTEPISWQPHVRWLTAALADPGRRIMIAQRACVPVGTVGLHPSGDGGEELSITVAPEQRGKGIGLAMLRAACREATQHVHASVRLANHASRRLFESCGFQAVESTEPGFVRYLRTVDGPRRKHA